MVIRFECPLCVLTINTNKPIVRVSAGGGQFDVVPNDDGFEPDEEDEGELSFGFQPARKERHGQRRLPRA